jgi:hypothetical protein
MARIMDPGSESGWSPTMSLETAYKLDDVREALRHGDLAATISNGQLLTSSRDRCQ